MKILEISSYLLCATVCSGLFLYISTRSWLYGTRIGEIDSSLLNDIFWTILTTFASLLILIFMTKKHKSDFVVLTLSLLISLQSFYEFYRGFFLFFDSTSFVLQFGSHWIQQPNSKIVNNISITFKCCGFFSVSDFPSKKCDIEKPVSCSSALSDVLGGTIHNTGIIIIGQSMAHLIIAFSLFYDFITTSPKVAF